MSLTSSLKRNTKKLESGSRGFHCRFQYWYCHPICRLELINGGNIIQNSFLALSGSLKTSLNVVLTVVICTTLPILPYIKLPFHPLNQHLQIVRLMSTAPQLSHQNNIHDVIDNRPFIPQYIQALSAKGLARH